MKIEIKKISISPILKIIFSALIILGIVILLPKYQTMGLSIPQGESIQKLENEYRKTIIQIIAGIFVFWGLMIANKRVQIHETQVRVSQEMLTTDRFSKAIEQLELDPKIHTAVVLGGIYTLDQIAEESEKIRPQVLKVLSAYVRSKIPNGRRLKNTELNGMVSENKKDFTKPTDPEIKTILEIFGMRPWVHMANSEILDLSETDLYLKYLDKYNFELCLFINANLEGASLIGANLLGACFIGANLKNANLENANLRIANFENTNLEGAKLEGAKLEGALKLTEDQLKMVKIDKDTKLPYYFEVTWTSDTEWEIKDRPLPPSEKEQ